jgi:phage regulator Rha-like protein
MSEIVKFNDVSAKMIELRNKKVIIDSDVAFLYGVETREINQAIKNNPAKFPSGYVFQLDKEEYHCLKSKFLILNNGGGRGQHVKYLPKAFTEKGLYMLATILKGGKAEQTTIDIVETYAKLRELSRTVSELSEMPDETQTCC